MFFSYKVPSATQSFNPNSVEFFDDFIGQPPAFTLGFAQNVSGTGAGVATTNLDSVGVAQLSTGTTAAGVCHLGTSNLAFFASSFNLVRSTIRMRVSALSAVGVEEYVANWGFGDSTSAAEHTDGVYFRYSDTINSGNLVLVCRQNNIETVLFTTFPMDTSYHIYQIDWTSSLCSFYVDSIFLGSISTNIPATAARACGPRFSMRKIAGTTARLMYADYLYLKIETSGR